eukprot:EC850335.1.p1 GENE.EC850335.1~~EC850335.1.p1  ORF type:complete len:115 (+),score=16.48 EC850335.1:53-397(+)
MQFIEPLPLTASRRPVFLEEEVEVCGFADTTLYNGAGEKSEFQGGTVILTSHRLLWKSATQDALAVCFPLSFVTFAQKMGGGLFRKAKASVGFAKEESGMTLLTCWPSNSTAAD